uniref:E3 ubiquitin-protein ligase E3D n=1 Tax=Caenorhabditis tropicalis TaxID=1561998 RepID=A0A1I7U8T7_9PELO
MIKSPLDSFGEWADMSVFLEIKPRCELASLFVDVPPGFREKQVAQGEQENRKTIKYADINVVNVTDNYIRIGAPPTPEALLKREKEGLGGGNKKEKRDRSTSGGSLPSSPTKKCQKKGGKKGEKSDFKASRFGATVRDVVIKASTLCSPTYGDTAGRVFMCKVNVEPSSASPLNPKTSHRLAMDVCKMEKLEEFAAKNTPRIVCGRCRLGILSEEYIMTIGCLPDDDFLATTQSADFFCRDSCGAACDPDRHKHVKREELKANPKWLPTEKRVMISYVNSIIHKQSVVEGNVILDEKKNIKCAGCKCQLGRVQKNHPDLYAFNHVAALMTAGPKKIPFVDKLNVPQLSIYMAQLILTACEAQTSMKLVIRTLDKVPYMLVWLLDSYVVIANGTLEGLRSEDEEGTVLTPFPAIKLLYKVFNNSTASSDPRANGEDTSVGLIDLPLPCCETLIELLLRSSLRSPPTSRAVGQFFVGYLQIDDHI